jgi:hypothetical protein
VVGLTFGVVIAIVASVLAVLALIILRRRRAVNSYSPHAFEEETTAIAACDEELSDFVSACGGGSSGEMWESPSVDYEIGHEDE